MIIKRKYTVLRRLKANQRMSAATFWTEACTRVISYLCALIILTLIISLAIPGTVEELSRICSIAALVLAVLWSIPVLRFTRFRLRDAGYSPKAYLWLLFPVIGWIVFAGLMCTKGTPQSPESNVEIL